MPHRRLRRATDLDAMDLRLELHRLVVQLAGRRRRRHHRCHRRRPVPPDRVDNSRSWSLFFSTYFGKEANYSLSPDIFDFP